MGLTTGIWRYLLRWCLTTYTCWLTLMILPLLMKNLLIGLLSFIALEVSSLSLSLLYTFNTSKVELSSRLVLSIQLCSVLCCIIDIVYNLLARAYNMRIQLFADSVAFEGPNREASMLYMFGLPLRSWSVLHSWSEPSLSAPHVPPIRV